MKAKHNSPLFCSVLVMNGEKAAYVSPVFSHKRQRTLESLIKGLQNDQWAKVEVCIYLLALLRLVHIFMSIFLYMIIWVKK